MFVLELGGEDDVFAACEAASAVDDVDVVAPGLATATGVSDRVAGLAYTHRVSEAVARSDASVAGARTALARVSLDREGTVAVRARDVRKTAGVDTQRAERALGTVLVERGFAVDLDAPDHELRALFADDVCVLGWFEAASVRDFGTRRPTDRPFFQPGSMDPLDARALANIAGARAGVRVLDPMCGTGGILVEAGLVGACVVGVDAQAKMVAGTRENLAHYLGDGFAVVRGDATRVPIRNGAVDAAVFDVPYGRQSHIADRSLPSLVTAALREADRVADRLVFVGDRDWTDAARDAGWAVAATFERRVHRSLVRHVHVCG